MNLEFAGLPYATIEEVMATPAALASSAAFSALTNTPPLMGVGPGAHRPLGSTVEEAVIEMVVRQEHLGHRVGQRMSRRAGQHMAKVMFVKFMVLLEILAMVPHVEWRSLDGQGLVEVARWSGVSGGR